MADVKQILVVDDHFEMLEFLRSMLELSNQDYEVLAVPSAEEGLLELRRGNFDLLITDVRLPGMSGFDLVRSVQRLGLKLPVIMITAYSSSQGRKEAVDLGILHYFQKPLDTDDVLTAVNKALHGDEARVAPLSPVIDAFTLTDELRKRLELLRVDTGALQLVLSGIEGEVLHSMGGSPTRIDQNKLATIIARNISDSFLLAQEIGSKEPFTLQYHAGARLELYCANVGEQYFLTLFFDAAARRGRIGTIWVFTQRAIKELQAMLPATPTPARTRQAKVPSPPKPAVKPLEQPGFAAPENPAQPPAPVQEPSKVDEQEEIELAPAEDLPVNIMIIGVPEETAKTAVEDTGFLDLAPEELAALLSGSPKSGDGDVDAFWDDALSLTGEEGQETNQGLTLEEAMQKGLLDTPDSS